jgi:hypothetical protein
MHEVGGWATRNRNHRSTKSADGRVATEAAWLNGNNLEKEEIKKKKEKRKMKEKP